jgi:hypothetical protein
MQKVPVESLKIKDKVFGIIGNNVFSTFEIEKITYSIGEATYRIIFEESELICSESHCVYVENIKNFKKVYQLTTEDKLKLIDKEVTIKSIQILKPSPVVGIFLTNGGCYFANGVLSHSQDVLPNFITKNIQSSGNQIKESTFKVLDVASKSIPSCVVEGSLISTPTGKVQVEQICMGDLVCGLDADLNKKNYKVNEKFSILSDIVYELIFDDTTLQCSDSHCVFSFTQYKFLHAWALTEGDYVLCENGIKELKNVKKINSKVVYALKFEDLGNYFANGIFSHSENYVSELFKNNSLNNSVFKAMASTSVKSPVSFTLIEGLK